MRSRALYLGLGLGICVSLSASLARSGAWPQDLDHSQWIVKAEDSRATKGFDPDGQSLRLSRPWITRSAYLCGEYGLSRCLTGTLKVNYQDFQTDTTHYRGMNSIEAGIRYQIYASRHQVLAFGVSAERLDRGRRNEFETGLSPHGTDTELRAYYGVQRDFLIGGRIRHVFLDFQLARRFADHRSGRGQDQWRQDITLGLVPRSHWQVLAQTYIGQTDVHGPGKARWAHLEFSLLRDVDAKGDSQLGLSWRKTLWGRNIPLSNTRGVSLWKRF